MLLIDLSQEAYGHEAYAISDHFAGHFGQGVAIKVVAVLAGKPSFVRKPPPPQSEAARRPDASIRLPSISHIS